MVLEKNKGLKLVQFVRFKRYGIRKLMTSTVKRCRSHQLLGLEIEN